MRRRTPVDIRPLASVIAALWLAGCTAAPDAADDHERRCAAQGLTRGSDSFERCVAQEEVREQEEFRRIRQARELLRDGGRL